MAAVTVSRSDYGILKPVLDRIQADPDLELRLIVAGMHLLPQFGATVDVIEGDGFTIAERIEMELASDTAEAVATFMGIGVTGFARVYAKNRPDMLLVLGDRYEMMAAVVAALPFRIPTAHIHGGESTEGVIDEAVRHSITKMSHIHFAATEVYARRIIQLGEEPWRVTVSGAPGLDGLDRFQPIPKERLDAEFRLDLATPPLLVTFHPVTLRHEQTAHQVGELLSALESSGLPVVFTYPGADAGYLEVVRLVEAFVQKHANARMVVNMGTKAYFSLMGFAAAMVGNSSSGIIEAASFSLPAINVGDRQAGRLRPVNVIDVEGDRGAILEGIRRATSGGFVQGLAGLINPYGDGRAAGRIIEVIKKIDRDARLLEKHFYDLSPEAPVKVALT